MLGVAKTAPGVGNVALVERPEPVVRPGHVVLEVVGAGICGTDLHIWDDEFPSEPPVTMGHEVSGVVREVGEGVDGLVAGRPRRQRDVLLDLRRVRVVPQRPAEPVRAAPLDRLARGRRVRAAAARARARPAPHPGLARRPRGRAGRAARVRLQLPARPAGRAARATPCSSSARARSGCSPRRSRGACGGDGPRARRAARRGAAREGARARLRDVGRRRAARRRAATSSIECSGSAAGIGFALESAARGGRLVQVGLAGRPVAIPFDLVCYRELTVTSGNASTPRSWRRALELIEARRVALEPLVSEVVPLAEWERAFAATREGSGIKFVLAPSI